MKLSFSPNLLTRIAACAALTLGVASAVQASPVLFSLTGDATASWQLDRSPVPDRHVDGQGFDFFDLAASFNGQSLQSALITFFSAGGGGGVQILDDSNATLLSAIGPQLYSGSDAAPTFTLGTFALTQFEGPGHFELTISAVPEPASWALVLAGLGLAGATTARRRRAG